jgi:pimeloyl-ACP methyl ester carboxylesterase
MVMAHDTRGSSTGRSIQVHDLNVYYEEQGTGQPLVLVHGGLVTAASWAAYLPLFAPHFRVIAPDARGHGHTTNPSGALSYALLADDLAAFIQALKLDRPLICGYSDGGQVALEIGMRYPGLARALVVGGAWYTFSDAYRAGLRAMGFESPGVVHTEQMERVAPGLVELMQAWHAPQRGPDYWQTLARQIAPMWLTPLGYTAADFQKVTQPTLVVIGDRDEFIPVEEALGMFRLLPQAELAVCPGADHAFPFTRMDRFAAVVLDFLQRQRGPRAQS